MIDWEKECKSLYDLQTIELRFKHTYKTESGEIIDEDEIERIDSTGGNSDKFITPESDQESRKLSDNVTAHMKQCNHKQCVQIIKSRKEAGLN